VLSRTFHHARATRAFEWRSYPHRRKRARRFCTPRCNLVAIPQDRRYRAKLNALAISSILRGLAILVATTFAGFHQALFDNTQLPGISRSTSATEPTRRNQTIVSNAAWIDDKAAEIRLAAESGPLVPPVGDIRAAIVARYSAAGRGWLGRPRTDAGWGSGFGSGRQGMRDGLREVAMAEGLRRGRRIGTGAPAPRRQRRLAAPSWPARRRRGPVVLPAGVDGQQRDRHRRRGSRCRPCARTPRPTARRCRRSRRPLQPRVTVPSVNDSPIVGHLKRGDLGPADGGAGWRLGSLYERGIGRVFAMRRGL